MRGNRKAYSGVEVVRMARDSGLIFAEQPRRRRWPLFVLAAGLVLLIAALPRLAVLLPAGVQRVDAALAARFVPRYEARLASLQAENTALRKHLAGAQIALAENDALRQWAGIERPAGRWQAARVVFRWHDHAELAGVYPVGAAVCDEQGRFAGRITEAGADRCTLTFAGYLSPAAAGFAGEQAGLLQKNWRLTGLPLRFTFHDANYAYIDFAEFDRREKAKNLYNNIVDGEDQDHHLVEMPFGCFGFLPQEQAAQFQEKYGYLGLQFLYSYPGSDGCDIMQKGVNKGAGLCELAGLAGLTPEECVAIGDGDNDTAMLAAAGMGIAMANGSANAKAAADRTGPDAEPHGVADLCRELWPEAF